MSRKPQFTEGPWEADYGTFETGIPIMARSCDSGDGRGPIVTEVWPMESDVTGGEILADPTALANAALIAAAPELLEACSKAAQVIFHNRLGSQFPEVRDQLSAAIKKALDVASFELKGDRYERKAAEAV